MLRAVYVAFTSEAVLSALVTLLLLGLAIVCFIGGWLAPELVALLAAGLLMAGSRLMYSQLLLVNRFVHRMFNFLPTS